MTTARQRSETYVRRNRLRARVRYRALVTLAKRHQDEYKQIHQDIKQRMGL